jgi:DNA-binding LytR/AlgR family response regulator
MEDPLKILIVDDEPEARELLKFILIEEEGIEVVGLAGNVDEAMVLMNKEQPDLVFLDIQMPDKDGFHFIKLINKSNLHPGVIFVTAFENYAIQAIRNSVFDYILKPIHKEELLQAIERFRSSGKRIQNHDMGQLIEALLESMPGKVKLNTRSGYILINPMDVVYCKADGNYTHIQMVTGTRELTTQNLGTIEELLVPGTFFRASRSYLVNLRYISRVDRKSSSCILDYQGDSYSVRIPAQKIKLLEATFT